MKPDPNIVKELVRKAISGHQEAFRSLFDLYYKKIVRYNRLVLHGDQEEAADIAQEAFIRAFQSLANLKDPECFGSWLFTIANNLCKTKRVNTVWREAKTQEFVASRQEDTSDRFLLLHEEKLNVVRHEIETLPEGRPKQLLQIYYVDGNLTTREIAKKMNVPHGTVCVTLMRLRARIQKKLAVALVRRQESSHAL